MSTTKNMMPNETEVPDWVCDFMNEKCFEWFVTTSNNGPFKKNFGGCSGLTVPHVSFALLGTIRLEFDGPLWMGINVINSLESPRDV